MQFLQKIFQTAAILRCSIILSAGTFAIMLLFKWLNGKKKSCVVIWQKTCWLSFWKRELLQAPTSVSDYKIKQGLNGMITWAFITIICTRKSKNTTHLLQNSMFFSETASFLKWKNCNFCRKFFQISAILWFSIIF